VDTLPRVNTRPIRQKKPVARQRRKRHVPVADGGFHGRIADPALAGLLDEIWAIQCADVARVATLCEDAVRRAGTLGDEAGVFWARLSRLLLTHRCGQPDALAFDDLEVAHALNPRLAGDARAQRLLAVADGAMLLALGRHDEALEHFQGLPLRSTADADEPDDYFVLRGLAHAASRLQRLELLFDALYANLFLSEHTGSSLRIAVASAELGAALVEIGRYADAMDVLEPRLRGGALRFANPLLVGHLRIHAAIASFGLGRAIEATDQLRALVGDGTVDVSRGFAFQVHANLMGVCLLRGLHDEALASALLAEDCASRMRRSAPTGLALHGAGLIAHARGRMDEAVELLERSLGCFEGDQAFITPLTGLADTRSVLSECHSARGDCELAYTTHRRFFEVHRQRAEFATRGHLAMLQARQNVAARIRLSERELQCLSWSAAGKTAWETGKILDLSEWTVVYHLQKAKRKFGLTRKQEVIAHAMSLGLIKPR
jgi:DNA-binding CsgD family transcriptional regulator